MMGEQTTSELFVVNQETGEATKFDGLADVSLSSEQNDEAKALTGAEFILNLAEAFGATIVLNSDTPGMYVNGKPVNFREFMGLPTNPAKRRKHVSKKRFKKLLMAYRYQRNMVDCRSEHLRHIYGVGSYKEIIEKYMAWVYRTIKNNKLFRKKVKDENVQLRKIHSHRRTNQ